MIDTATIETFAAHVGSTFELLLEGAQHLSLTLGAAELIPTTNPAAVMARPPFSLIFRPPAGLAFAQGTYLLRHATLGTLELFLVPVQPDAGGPRLEAVFT